MHFFKNSVSFIAVMSVFGVALAAVAPARVGVVTNATVMRRLPSLSNVTMKSASSSTSATATLASSSSDATTGTGLLSDTECFENYRECMKSDNACGSDFEECTTNVLFHGRMSECYSTLYQCSPDAIEKLVGTNNLSALSDVDSYVEGTKNTEVARYAYPTDGSIMGMDIIGAATRNKLSTADCVKKYKNCLTKDNVCGEDFELCTTTDEFKKQAVMCDSTLARCQKEGFQQLFGEKQTMKPAGNALKPNDGDTKKWMDDGASLAAANAVNTCYKVVDSCFINACAKNPYRCVEGINFDVLNSADFVAENKTPETSADATADMSTETQTASTVRKFYRAACQDTIGSNKYCYMTFKEKTPSKKDLTDADTREEIFDEAYATRNKKDILGTKVTTMVEKFDTTAKNKCIETFKSCAVRSCGGGSGAACYYKVFGKNQDLSNSINNAAYEDVARGCAAVVNTDVNCRYMAATQNKDNNVYTYSFSNDEAFDLLFPKYDDANPETKNYPAVAALNADLATTYNDAAIEGMKKQCQNVVANCVKSMCGKDYQNCYRNRNDIYLATYATGNADFDNSMNKIGGILDYTIIQGLCTSTVKNTDACAESLAIHKLGVVEGASDVTAKWGANDKTISSAWRSTARVGYSNDMVAEEDDNGRKLCKCKSGGKNICGFEGGGDLDCMEQSMVSQGVMIDKTVVTNVFQDVLFDVELEAQAQYKAKLTKEQNICLAQNNGSNPDKAYVWAELTTPNRALPDEYTSKGLGNNSKESNNLYGSFCRIKVVLRSNDKDVQNALSAAGGESAYFAMGDPFTCGSWMNAKALETITQKVGDAARKEAGEGSQADKNTRLFATLGGTVLGGGLGAFAADKLQTGSLGGLLNPNLTKNKAREAAKDAIDEAEKKLSQAVNDGPSKGKSAMTTAISKAKEAKKKLEEAGIEGLPTIPTVKTDTTEAAAAIYGYADGQKEQAQSLINQIDGYCKEYADANPNAKGACNNIQVAQAYLNGTITGAGSNTQVKTTLQGICNDSLKQYDQFKKPGTDVKKKAFKENVIRVCNDVENMTLTSSETSAKRDASSTWNSSDVTELSGAITKLREKLEDADDTKDGKSQRAWIDVAGGVIGAAAVGGVTHLAVRKIQEAQYEGAEKEAVKKWMEDIGSKIQCYVGGDMVADFGTTVALTPEDK